jgi:hypothetical protein
MDTKQAFGVRLTQALDHQGISPVAADRKRYLSKLLDITERHAGNYLRGDKLPSSEGMIDIAKKLRINPTWLIAGIGPMQPLSDAEIAHILMLRTLTPSDQEKVFRVSEVFQNYTPDQKAS